MDLLECPVCLETFQDPVLLPSCGHTFCRACVNQILAVVPAGLNTLGLASARCPTCRGPFRPSDPRPNYALQQLLSDRGASTGGAAAVVVRPSTSPPVGISVSSGAPSSCGAANGGSGGPLRRGLTRDNLGASAHVADMAKIRRLEQIGVPFGLAKLLEEEDRQIGAKIFLLDNSGSTQAYDGHYFETLPDGRQASRPCSRWEEIRRMALEQATWNLAVGTPCEFVLLNPGPPPLVEGRDFVRIDGSRGMPGQEQQALDSLRRMLDATGPRGVTPIADRLEEIHQRILGEYPELATRGQRVVLVIATDGLPTSAQSGQCTEADKRRLVTVLKRLASQLPVHMVIRLTTDDDGVIDYYNKVDEEVELPLEVLDDIESEAKEIWQQGNGWLTYSPLLHRIREGGTFVKLFDLLDERKLTPVEVSLFAQLLLRGESEAPLPRTAADFCQALEAAAAHAPAVYNPLTRRVGPPINLSAVRWAVMPASARVGALLHAVLGTLTSPLRHLGVSCTGGYARGALDKEELVF